tara:strand:+ start:1737 stop:3797 length:2061 start_codon:yes stop_codon:yes gene_type:complete
MKRELQLYIQDTRVDLFKDETVSLTDTIQNVRDIAKIFTTFTKTFTLPASAVNNKLFKHYYNFDILNTSLTKSAFDARKKVTARIELNHVPFKEGKIKLEGVDMKSNQPSAYRVTFFGNTVDLKDIIGEDKLNVLTSLNSLNKDFDESSIKTHLETNPASSDIIVPLITHTQRLYYDSGDNDHNTGNLDPTSNKHGVRWDNLKYAIRVHNIIEAIQTQYSLTFSNDFFTETSNDQYSKLFMWLHRKKGVVETGDQIANFPSIVDGWSTGVGTSGYTQMVTTSTLRLTEDAETFGTAFTLTLTSPTGTYDILIEKDGVSYFSENGISASKTINLFTLNGSVAEAGDYTVTITVTSAVTFSNIRWSITTDEFGTVLTDQFSTSSYTASATFEFVITSQIPEMKVIDFLSGIFKMFNLTAFVNNAGTIVVKTLDSYYSGGATYDITQYVDVESSQVNVALPFKEIQFGYGDTDTFFAAIHNQLFNKEWGTSDFNNNEALDGGLYKIELPFGHMKFERLVDIHDSSSTATQWGWSVDDNQDSYIGKPVLFYPVYTSVGSKTISFVTVINEDGTFHTDVEITGSINMPSNSVAFASGTSTANINFFNELNEYTGDDTFTGTLFQNFYSTYITQVFDSKNRLSKIKARLPMNILLNYSLADKFRISGTEYRINSITTNLTTGEADIELLNVL